MTTTTTTAMSWTMIPVDQLADQVAGATPDAELTESITADGIIDPLYVITTSSGPRVVDGLRRLTAAIAAGLTEVPTTPRPVIRVEHLTAHPGNVRTNLSLTKAFLNSVDADGVRIPLKINEAGRVIDGHRRLAAAIKRGHSHVPYELDERDEAGQMLDMVITSSHREGLTVTEEAAALFAAAELGAGVRRLAAASGRTQADVKKAVSVGQSAAAAAAAKARAAKAAPGAAPLTLDQLAQIAELEQRNPAAAKRASDKIAARTNADASDVAWIIRREITALDEEAKLNARRAELEAAGARIRTLHEISESALPVSRLRDVENGDGHAGCQGDAWVMTGERYTRYCTSPGLFGHTMPESADTQRDQDKAARRLRIAGNRDWDTATALRQQWLTAQISPKSLPKARQDEFTAIVTAELISGGPALCARLSHGKRPALTAEFLGIEDADTLTQRAAKAPRRAAAFQFATLAAAAELNIPRTAWRTADSYNGEDRYAGAAARRRAAAWLTTLTTLGYEPTPIEAAILADETYIPETDTPHED